MTQKVECAHCGYDNEEQAERLCDLGDEGAWTCPACGVCNTTYHLYKGFKTELGYQRELDIEYK